MLTAACGVLQEVWVSFWQLRTPSLSAGYEEFCKQQRGAARGEDFSRAFGQLDPEEAGALGGGGQGTELGGAEEADAVAGQPAIERVAQAEREDAGEAGEQGPAASEDGEGVEDGVGAEGEGLAGCCEVRDQDSGVDLLRVEGVAGEDLGGEGVLLGGEAQAAFGVVAQEPADGVLAEAALAVVEQNVPGEGCGDAKGWG